MYEEIKKRYQDLEKQLMDPDLSGRSEELIKISKEHAGLKKAVALILQWEKNQQEIQDSREIIAQAEDADLSQMLAAGLPALEEQADKLKEELEEELHPANPNDKKNAILEIRAGAGGDEAALFAGDLFRLYARYCERRGWKMELLNSSLIGLGGFKEVIFMVKGEGAYGRLKFEAGTHRVQRVPETEKQGRVHTSTATVVVLPEADEVDIEIKPADLRIDTFCSSGPGGQSVNTTYSAIRVLHLPTGIIVSCQDQKSQHQNKEKALQVLRSRLLAKQEEERRLAESSARQTQVGGGDRSDKIRTYNFPQDRVTDHRVNESWHSLPRIMDGEIEEIVETLNRAAKTDNQSGTRKNESKE